LDASRIELGFHYHRDCQVDRQARGTLSGFRAWTAATNPELDAIKRAAAAVGEQVNGNIGDRDHLRYLDSDYDLVEAQGRRGDFASWRVYLYDRAAGTAERLDIATHRGSTAVANPTATMLRDPTVRHDGVFLFDVTDGNPNGDPDAGNRPRTDDETGQGLVTDVALKRKIRDTIGHAATTAGLDPARYQVFVQAGHALNTRLEESYTTNNLALGKKDKAPITSVEQATPARRWMTERYVDIRLFGAVMSTGNTPALGKIRGPLQFGMARSIDPIYPVDHAITRVTQTTQADIDKGESTEMGSKWTVPYALYRVELHYSGERGKQTAVTRDDLNVLYTTMLNMFDHDRTATRGVMSARGLYLFSHNNSFGNAPAQTLLERVHIERIGTEVPRTFGDYKVTLNDRDLPSGVTLARLLG